MNYIELCRDDKWVCHTTRKNAPFRRWDHVPSSLSLIEVRPRQLIATPWTKDIIDREEMIKRNKSLSPVFRQGWPASSGWFLIEVQAVVSEKVTVYRLLSNESETGAFRGRNRWDNAYNSRLEWPQMIHGPLFM